MKTPLFSILCCCFSLVIAGCGRKPASHENTPTKANSYFKTPFQDESEFIVETILNDLAEMTLHGCRAQNSEYKVSADAIENRKSTFGSPVYSVEILSSGSPPFKIDLNVDGPIWSPIVYDQIAARFAQHVALATPTNPDPRIPPLLLDKLTDFTAITLENENQRLSKLMTEDFNNPELHEQAALLLGTLALRECSGEFYEIRSMLCRITSHLAFANVLRGGSRYGQDGRIAEAVLYLLMNNQRTALEKIKAIDQTSASAAAWCRALRARITCDYRELDTHSTRTGVETVMHFYAVANSIGADAAFKKFSAETFRKSADFTRIAHATPYSVGLGHELLRQALPLELSEATTIYRTFHGAELSPERLVSELNHLPGRCISNRTVRIIDWGHWALFFQRHVCSTIACNFEFIQEKWGVPDHARKFSAQSKQLFSAFRLYPFVAWITCTDQQTYRSAVDAGFRVTVDTPHLVTPEIWNKLCYKPDVGPLYSPNPNPHINEWHKHNPPPGTAYTPSPRTDHPSLVRRRDTLQLLDKLHDMAPYDTRLTYNVMRIKYDEKPTYEQAVDLYFPVLDYSPRSISSVARRVAHRPDEYEVLLTRAVAMDPSFYASLGEHYLTTDQPDKAIKAFEKIIEHDPDTVSAVACAPWMVRYYFDRGMTDKASEVAEMGAQVYSYAGLRAKALYLELSGKYDHALTWCKKIEERYNYKYEVAGFYARFKAVTGNPRYDAAAAQALKPLFPKGIQRVTLNHFKDRPTSGVLVNQDTLLLRKAGLAKGDIITALYGIRVHNLQQYLYACRVTNDPEMEFIVWKPSGTYVVTKGAPPDHRFRADLTTYPAE